MYMGRNDSRYFNELIKQTQPMAMFFGHQHLKTRQYTIGQTKVFILRSSCWNFNNAPIGFTLVKITDKGITTKELDTGFYDTKEKQADSLPES